MTAIRMMALDAALLAAAMSVIAAEPAATATPATAATPTPAAAEPTPAAAAAPVEDPDQLDLIRDQVEHSWSGFMKKWLQPNPVDKSVAIRIDEKHAYPHPAIGMKMEIVKEDENTLWLRGIPPEEPDSPLHEIWLQRQGEQVIQQAFSDWEEKYGKAYYILDFGAEIVPPPFVDGFQFVPVTSGLPDQGRWQMNFALADMNGDGHVDIVTPPMRKGTARPFVFLGDGEGGFREWRGLRFSRDVPFDYGAVAVADFDGDGHLDIALAIHLKNQWVLYGDGAGDFSRVRRLSSPDPRVTSRAVTAADFDGDGRVDLAFEGELDLDMSNNQRITDTPTVWIQRNAPDGWRLVTDDLPTKVIGDSIAAADMDGDGRPDLVLSSNSNNYRQLVWLNGADGWHSPGERLVLANAYHFDVEPAPVAADFGTIFATFTQFQLIGGENLARTGLIQYRLGDEGPESREGPFVLDDDRLNSYVRLAAGDIDGNGLTDVVAGRKDGGLEVYLQLQDGAFYREQAPELDTTGRPYWLAVRDLDGDGDGDIIGAFATHEDAHGGITVWLTSPRG